MTGTNLLMLQISWMLKRGVIKKGEILARDMKTTQLLWIVKDFSKQVFAFDSQLWINHIGCEIMWMLNCPTFTKSGNNNVPSAFMGMILTTVQIHNGRFGINRQIQYYSTVEITRED